jgi:hypothetical protein
MSFGNPFSSFAFGEIFDSVLPDFVLAFTFFTALIYAVLGKRFGQQRPAIAASAALGLALSVGLVWWEQASGMSIRNLGPVAVGFAVLILAGVIHQAVRQTGGNWAGAGIALGASLLVAWIMGTNSRPPGLSKRNEIRAHKEHFMLRPKSMLHAAQVGVNPSSRLPRQVAPFRLPNRFEQGGDNQIHRGVLLAAGQGRTYTATVDRRRQHVGLAVRLETACPLQMLQMLTLARIQADACLVRLDYDGENGSIWLRARSVLLADADANAMFGVLMADASMVLADSRLAAVVAR